MVEFEGAISRDQAHAGAYAGLAETYDLPRQYTATPPAQAYPLAREAAGRALALDPDLADAHTALAFADYWGFWDARAARAHFRRALELDPRGVLAHHWYATFLVSRGEAAEALTQIDAAPRLDPTSRAIQMNRAFILAKVGREPEAVAILRRLAAANPAFLSPHQYLSGMAYDMGDDVTYLDERAKTAALLGSREALEALAGLSTRLD